MQNINRDSPQYCGSSMYTIQSKKKSWAKHFSFVMITQWNNPHYSFNKSKYGLGLFNPLHPNISIHFLHAVFYTLYIF